MLKTIRSLDLALKMFRINDDEVVRVNDRVNEMVKNSFKSKKSKNDKSEILIRSLNIGPMGKPIFLTPDTRKAFNL